MRYFRSFLMTTEELLKEIPIPRNKLYYLENKGYINPKKTLVGEKEFRDYTPEDAKKIKLIWKYLQKGFRYRIAYEKTLSYLHARNNKS